MHKCKGRSERGFHDPLPPPLRPHHQYRIWNRHSRVLEIPVAHAVILGEKMSRLHDMKTDWAKWGEHQKWWFKTILNRVPKVQKESFKRKRYGD